MPDFTRPVHESNDCHNPAGSPAGGEFCSDGKTDVQRYGKAAAELLRQARANPHGRVSITYGYIGRRRFGARDLAAARKLVKAGLLRHDQTIPSTPEYRRRNFGRDSYTGRARIAQTRVGEMGGHVYALVK
jgi:hypothetical protein